MNSEIDVSVIIPLLNEEKYIRGCVESLIKQTYPLNKMEWIFVDGCSSDNTLKIIDEYMDKYPIMLLTNVKKKTPFALNLGIDNARGKYIIRMDAHAKFANDYIEKCVYYLETTDADNVGGIAITKSEGFVGNAIANMLSTKFGVGGSSFRVEDKSGYVDTVPFGAFRAEVFKKYGKFNTELLRSEDNEINARIRNNGGKVYLSKDIKFVYFCRNTISSVLKMALQNGNALFRTYKIDPKAMSLRHYIPFLFFISLITLPVVSHFNQMTRWIFYVEIISYSILDMVFSLLVSNRKYAIISIWLYPLFHFTYGLGSFLGLIGIDLY